MNAARTFEYRLTEFAKQKTDPTLLIPPLEVLEEILIKFHEDLMADKDTPVDEKGRMATVIAPMLRGVRNSRDKCLAAKQRADAPAPRKLHNSHLT